MRDGDDIEKCLTELGLATSKVSEYMLRRESGDTGAQIRILKAFRAERVDRMHGIYKDLECLDYMIGRLEKKRSGQ